MFDINKIIQSPGFHIGFVSQALRNNITKRFNDNGFDITFAQWPMLVALSHFENISQNEISKMMQRDKTTIARMLSLMEKNGLIKRLIDPFDKRNKIINLTDKGKELFQNLVPIMIHFIDEMCEGIPREEISMLNNTLGKIFENIEGVSLCDAGSLTKEKILLTNLNEKI